MENNWILWGIILFVQNISFTYVSRARNSASLMRHFKAAQFSNGVWFASQLILFGTFMKLLSGQAGWGLAVETGVFYVACTTAGSLSAHWWSMKHEKGKNAVGANDRYAQIPKEEWETVRRFVMAVEEDSRIRRDGFGKTPHISPNK